MGVMRCDRDGCDNILCNRCGSYKGRWYYICNDCFNELVKLGPQVDIEAFMDGYKVEPDLKVSGAYFDEIFPNMDG
jgi:hypothetical protein